MSPTPKPKRPRLTRTSLFLTTEQHARLAAIHEATGIPVAFLIRQAVDRLLAEHTPKARQEGRR